MSLSASEELAMNTISGRVILKESGVGIPDLLVVLYSPTAPTRTNPSAPPSDATTAPDFRVSVLTDRNGAFAVSVQDADFKAINPQDKRPDLHLNVLAPEEPGIMLQELILFSALVQRQNAGRTEQYMIRLSAGQLQKAGIPIP